MASGTTLGIDIGGTKVEVALVDTHGNVLSSDRFPSGIELSPDGFIAQTLLLAQQLQSATDGEIDAVGVGAAGQIEPVTGIVRESPNLVQLGNFPLKSRLEEAFNVSAFVTNDVRAAAFGEWQRGAGQGVSDLVALFVGTGVGGGIIHDNRVVVGATGTAGEVGHMTIDMNGAPCRCRNRGCLESLCGGWAIALRTQQAIASSPSEGAAILGLCGGSADEITASTVSQAFHNGDPLAGRIIEETGRALAAGITSLVHAFNPRMVVLGGGVIEGTPELIDMAREQVFQNALSAATGPLEIVRAHLGGDAIVIGAALMARRSLEGSV